MSTNTITDTAFDALHAGICREIGSAMAPLRVEMGIRSFTLQVSEMDITVMHYADTDPRHVWIAADLGRLDDEGELMLLLALLTSNFSMLGEHDEPGYSRNADTGALYHQRRLPLHGVDPRTFLQLLDVLANTCADALGRIADMAEAEADALERGAQTVRH